VLTFWAIIPEGHLFKNSSTKLN